MTRSIDFKSVLVRTLTYPIFLGLMSTSLVSCSNIFEAKDLKNLNASQIACSGFKKMERKSIFWSKSFPIKLYVNSAFPEDKKIALKNAIYIWNTTFDADFFSEKIEISESLSPSKDQKNVIYWLTDWALTDVRAGTTVIYAVENNIVEADVVLNANNYILTADSPKAHETDLNSVLIHELGHVLGLDHIGSLDSIMQNSLMEGEERISLSAEDRAHIECMYL